MNTISNLNELINNFRTIDGYLYSKADPEYSFALDLIKKGICFVAVKDSNTYKFYPSRFIGYTDNSMNKHQNSADRDGRVTNKIISIILDDKLSHDPILNQEYKKYCELLGFKAQEKGSFGVERKFWLLKSNH